MLALAIGTALSIFIHEWWGTDFGQFDLKIYRDALSFWSEGHGDLYDFARPDAVNGSLGFTYPPFAAVLLAPLSWLTADAATAVMLVLTTASTSALVFLMIRTRVSTVTWLVCLGAVVGAVLATFVSPVDETLGFGQINLVLALLVAGDVLYLVPKRSKWAGIGIGTAMAVKLTPGIFLLALLLTRRWSAAVRAVVTGAAATLLAAAIAPRESWKFFTSVLWQTDRVGPQENVANQSLSGLLARLWSPESTPTIWWLLSVGIILAVGAIRVRAASAAGDQLAVLALAGMVGLLVSPVSWIHHCVWVLPALLAVGWDVARLRPRTVLWWRSSVLLVSGWYIWFQSMRRHFDLPDLGYQDAGFVRQMEASLPLAWMVLAVLTLPLLVGTGSTAHELPVGPSGRGRSRARHPGGTGA